MEKLIINPADIKTMRKDIKQIKRFGFLGAKKEALKTVKIEPEKEKPKEAILQENKAMGKVITEAAQHRKPEPIAPIELAKRKNFMEDIEAWTKQN